MDIRYEPHGTHLLVVAGGRFSPAECRDALAEIRSICAERQLGDVLIDFRAVEGTISIADRYDLGRLIADNMQSGRMAILVAPGQRFTSTLEDTAVNRGAQVRTTDSEEAALRFLDLAPPTS